nr:DUF2735 domain-containing protein [Kaistia hirudinis]
MGCRGSNPVPRVLYGGHRPCHSCGQSGETNVNRTEQRESATIIPFPVRARAGASGPQPYAVADLPVVDSASWYHEAAMREDEQAGTH